MRTALIVIEFIISIAIIVVVLLQPSKSEGLSGLMIGSTSDTFFSKNKSRTSESRLIKLTIVLAIIFGVIAVLLNLSIIK